MRSISAILVIVMIIAVIVPIGVGVIKGVNESKQNHVSSTGDVLTSVGLSLSETEVTIDVGATKTLKINTEIESDNFIYQWDSDNKEVATVTRGESSAMEGIVTGLKGGTATITVNVIDKVQFKIVESATCTVTVSNTTIVFSKSSVILALDGTTVDTVTAESPDGGAISWYSENESVATVVDGVITAVSAGSTYIVAKSGSFESKLPVKVYASIISLDATALVAVGGNAQVGVHGNLAAGSVWSVDDSTVATVDQSGRITGLKAGMTIVRVASSVDDQVASCVVIVKTGSEESSQLLSGKKAAAAADPGNWYYLCESEIVTVADIPVYDNGVISFNITGIGPSGANFFYLRYQPDDVGLVTYRNVLYIYAEQGGTHQINGKDYTLVAGINRLDLEYESVAPSGQSPYQIKLKTTGQFYVLTTFEEISRIEKMNFSSDNASLNVNDTVTITASVPNQVNPTVEWTSSNPEIATVEGGVITAVAPGSAIITAKCGSFTEHCYVYVKGGSEVSLTSGNKSDTLANAGKWYYFADGKTSTYAKPVMDADGKIHYAINNIDNDAKKYAYLRYQPDVLGSYTVTITIEYIGDGSTIDITGGDVTTAVSKNIKNGANVCEFTFTANSSNPLQIKIKGTGVYVFDIELVENN